MGRAAHVPRIAGTLVALAAFVGAPACARSDAGPGDLREALAGVARDVARFLEARRDNAVSVGQFTGPPNFPTSAGPGIAHALSDELRKAGLDVRSRAPVGIKGEYRLAEVERYDPVAGKPAKTLAVEISGSLVDSLGGVLTDFRFERPGTAPGRAVTDEEAIVSLFGLPAELSESTPAARDKQLRAAYDEPPVSVAGSRVSAGPGSPYSVEILVGGRPVPVRTEDGLPYVDLGRGDVYVIRIRNESPYDAAAEVLIDGLNVFTFSDVRHESGPKQGEPKYAFFVIQQGVAADVHGWHRTNERVDSFRITDYAGSAAATLDRHAGVGTITVAFRAAWPPGEPPPPDEPPARKGAGDATGFGPPKDVRAEPVKRQHGRLRSSVSIRYVRGAAS